MVGGPLGEQAAPEVQHRVMGWLYRRGEQAVPTSQGSYSPEAWEQSHGPATSRGSLEKSLGKWKKCAQPQVHVMALVDLFLHKKYEKLYFMAALL